MSQRNTRPIAFVFFFAIMLSLFSFSVTAACESDQFIPLVYPEELHVFNKPGIDDSYKPFVNQQLSTLTERADKGAPINVGGVWVPKEACGQKVDLLIALHGWRSLSKPGDNIFVNSPTQTSQQKDFDKIVAQYIAAGKARPVIIAAPLHDRGPSETVFTAGAYDVNEHIRRINTAFVERGLNIQIGSVSLAGHSNANCGGGLARAAAQLSGYPLYLYGAMDGTCGSDDDAGNAAFFQTGGRDVFGTVKNKGAILFHMHQSAADSKAVQELKTLGGGNDPNSIETGNYNEMWKSSDGKFYSYSLKPGGDRDHTFAPQYWLREVLPRFFPATGSVIAAETPTNPPEITCDYTKIGVMGASNTITAEIPSYFDYLKKACAGTTFYRAAKGGYGIAKQGAELLADLLTWKSQMVIISPSGNTCDEGTAAQGISRLIAELNVIQAEESVKHVVIIPISVRDNAQSECVKKFNEELNARDFSPFDFIVSVPQTNNVLLDPENPDRCGYCKIKNGVSDQKHWSAVGQARVATVLLNNLFGGDLEIPRNEADVAKQFNTISKGTASGTLEKPAGTAAPTPVGTKPAVTTSPVNQLCQSSQRCREVDDAWRVLQGTLPLPPDAATKVWVPAAGWRTYNEVYTTSTTQAAPNTPVTIPQQQPPQQSPGILQPLTIPKKSDVKDAVNVLKINFDKLGELDETTSDYARLSYDFVVLHDGGTWGNRECPGSVRDLVAMFQKKGLSSHYFICGDGTIYQLASEKLAGIHAGCTSSDPTKNCPLSYVNYRSIGIDLQSFTNLPGDKPYTQAQHTALNALLQDISQRRGMPLDDNHILAHFEVVKGHHNDPKEGFNWLAINGVTYDHRTKNGPGVFPAVVTNAVFSSSSSWLTSFAGASSVALPLAGSCDKERSSTEISDIRGSPSISSKTINKILQDASSPAVGSGTSFITYSKQYNIDPVFALAFFKAESTFGKFGAAKESKGIGNIVYVAEALPDYKYHYTAKNTDYAGYNSWGNSVKGWYNYLTNREFYFPAGKFTLSEIVADYTTSDTTSYVSKIEQFVKEFRAEEIALCG